LRLAIISSHPIQYNAPLFRLLQQRGKAEIKVFYTWGDTVLKDKFDPGFNRSISWDIPLLEGYAAEFPENTATEKGSHHFHGIINPGLIGLLKTFSPDALLVYGWSFDSHLKVMRYFKGKRTIIVRGDSTLMDPSPFYKKLARNLFLRWVYRHADYAVYVGKNNHAYYRKMGMKDRQLVYGPHAIDNDRFSGATAGYELEALSLRRELSIPEEAIVFLFAGKLESKKAPDLLLQAFEKAGLQDKAWLVIVGNGEQESVLKERFGRLPNVRFLDFQNQSRMPVIYRLSDVFVLPSRGPGETWGLAINEAMASGRAVLASDRCGGAVDLIQSGVNGYVVKGDDIDDLLGKINLLSASKTVLKKMGEASGRMIAGFSYEKIADAIDIIIDRITLSDRSEKHNSQPDSGT
jgi:glycosyltransferase involved in cell wall biosynthesis